MPQQLSTTTENNFTKGLITEATGLNFPENAATDTDNCVYTLIGDVIRREGIDFEVNGSTAILSRGNSAVTTYKWNNVGGDGLTQVVVSQIGGVLYFYLSSAATVSQPLSSQLLTSTVNLSTFAVNGVFDITKECQYSDGNGYLFVYNGSCDPFYCTYNSATQTITANTISISIRDFAGVNEGNVPVNLRPPTLTNPHLYNLENQGWTTAAPWSLSSPTPFVFGLGVLSIQVQSGASVSLGTAFIMSTGVNNGGGFSEKIYLYGTVTGYSGTTMTLSVSSISDPRMLGESNAGWLAFGGGTNIAPSAFGHIQTWVTAIGNYPSNADQWWAYKDNTNVFNPAVTYPNVTFNSGPAPQGFYVLNAFRQQRSSVSGVAGLTDIVTTQRPKTGCWFQGRVWYTGVDSNSQASGTALYTTWTENIYFSQIVETPTDFGSCYQTNDPTSEDLFDLLPTDGGVIVIQGAGSIYKLFPIQNGMLVFAANGVWFITGSQGIGFSANDYTITKISSVRSISSYSFVDVNGLPYFWNEEGIYSVEPTQGGSLQVNPLTVGTILTYYNAIPTVSKQYARAAYDPINYIIQWLYKSTEETSVTDRYAYDRVMNFNTANKAFYPYKIGTATANLNSIIYVSSPGGLNAPDSIIKYLASNSAGVSFADEHDEDYVDWASQTTGGVNYNSYFVTGYKLRGQGIKKFQPQYIQVYSRQNGAMTSYEIQGIWDYANDPNSGRWSSPQLVTNALTRFDTVIRRHKIRGHGYSLQFKVKSVDGLPFDIQGWATVDTTNTGT